MRSRHYRFLLAAVGFGLPFAIGCSQTAPQVGPAEAPAASVAQAVDRVVTDYVDFTGRTDAINSVNVVPRVTGYLVKISFKEGSEVRKDDLLFEIDPRPYQAQLDQAQSQVALYQAAYDLSEKTLDRYVVLDKTTPGAVSKQELDQYRASVVEAAARVEAAKKSLEVYQLNKDFTRVTSSIDGQISRYYLTIGNLVNQDQTLLTTVVSLDPMHVYFEMDERTLIQIRKAIFDGKITPYNNGTEIPVTMALPGENGFPHAGTINFINNQVNSGTGSISMRGLFRNPRLSRSDIFSAAALMGMAASPVDPSWVLLPSFVRDKASIGTGRLLSPGMFVRVRLPLGQPHQAHLVVDRAIQSDQGKKFVYVLDAENKAQQRYITTGALQPDGLRVVEGLQPDDWIVVGALQSVHARSEVRPQKGPMPILGQTETKNAGKENGKPAKDKPTTTAKEGGKPATNPTSKP